MESIRLLPDDCPIAGDDAPELYEPIVEYARKHLAGEIARFTGYTPGEIEGHHSTSPSDLPPHRDGFHTMVVVTRKSRVGRLTLGQLEVFQGRHTWGASIDDCLHGRTEDEQKTIVIEKLQSLIGLHRAGSGRTLRRTATLALR